MSKGNILIIVAALVLLASGARADVRPKILIIFDTSGSMLSPGGPGDGSALCGNQGTSTRIYQLKQALFQSLQGMGATEIDFALATFPMMMDPTRNPQCCSTCSDCAGHYYTVPAQNSEVSGQTSRRGCKVSTHNPLSSSQQNANCGDASNPCAAWYNNYKQEALWVEFGAPIEQVLLHFDQQEDSDQIAPLVNPEVRADGNWYTPLGKSLFYAHGYFDKDVIPSITAYEKPCTNLVVAFFTDGAETCNSSSSNAFYPTKWASNLHQNLGVTVHTVAIDTSHSLLQSIANNGGGTRYIVGGNISELKQAFLDIVAKSLPPYEACNGLDDDCDKLIDEDFPQKGQPCDNGKLGVCYKTGVYVCKADGSGVTCNAPNANGTAEICNGLDDDCDGEIDEGLPNCQPKPCQPEVCNGVDDDCDTQVDEGIPSQPCGKDVGECKPGNTKCENGKIICDGGVGPTPEVCNGLDDDCDGARDGMTESCYEFSTGCEFKASVGWLCTGFCQPGVRICTAQQVGGVWTGVWGQCLGQVGPSKEVCNGLDDDCDGEVDEDAECPEGSKCINGVCTGPCMGGEFSCPTGQLCEDGWCVPDPCDPSQCPEGWVCKAGQCVDPCINVTCGKYEECVKGACVDMSCYNPANKCPEGETCIQGECKPDPCATVECSPDEFCKDGVCVTICATMTCPEGQVCKVVDENGTPVSRCVEDPCANQQCGEGYVCFNGVCVEDPCFAHHCDKGQLCIVLDEGGTPTAKCIQDPCETVDCPTGFHCSKGVCISDKVVSTRDLLGTGGGGCACSVEGDESPPVLWLMLVSLFLVLRRRR